MEQEYPPINNIITEFGIKLNELEEKQRLLKDRILLIGNNLLNIKEEYDKQFLEIKNQIKEIKNDLRTVKQLNDRITNEMNNFAKKSELEILKNQFKIFEPLEFARIEDVKNILKEELTKLKKEL